MIEDTISFMKKYKNNKLGLVGLGLLIFFVQIAVFAPYIAPYDPHQRFESTEHPNSEHLLGTNHVGQDILSELIYGTRVSLFITLFASIAAVSIGILIGLIAGYFKRFDFSLMRLTDLFLTIPKLPMIIIIAAFMLPSVWNLVFIFAIFEWAITARIIRSEVLTLRNRNYVDATRLFGAKDSHILARHILPYVVPLVFVQLVLVSRYIILAESGLSFIGLGDPTAKSWGMMLHDAFEYPSIFISDLWMWWMLPAGLCIVLTILSLTFIGYALEEIVNPSLKRSPWI
ncbi:MAG TPA: ABC transporter permease [Methanophagales archaeon]|nr:ABC transporter permease [Methanophagales archaeon]